MAKRPQRGGWALGACNHSQNVRSVVGGAGAGLGWHYACSGTGCGRAWTAISGALKHKTKQSPTSMTRAACKSSLTKPRVKAYSVRLGGLPGQTRLFAASDQESDE
jgi:hypothetical protein